MDQGLELMKPAEVDATSARAIEAAVERFAVTTGGRAISWYHDQPLWYLIEKGPGASRSIQLALVKRRGSSFVEATGDFELQRDGRVFTPEQVDEPLLRYLPLDEVTTPAVLELLEDIWRAAERSARDLEAHDSGEMTETELSPRLRKTDDADAFGSLSDREQQVLSLLAQGVSSRDIADGLSLSPNTVRTHIQSILNKLGVHSRLEAAVAAMRAGLVQVTAERQQEVLDELEAARRRRRAREAGRAGQGRLARERLHQRRPRPKSL